MGEAAPSARPPPSPTPVADAVAPLGVAITALPIVAERLARPPHHPQRKA